MQPDGNSFCGDIVLDSLNMVYRDKDSILDQKYEKQFFTELYYEDLKFFEWDKNIFVSRNTAHNIKKFIKLCLSATVLLVCIFDYYYVIKNLNHHDNNPNIYLFYLV